MSRAVRPDVPPTRIFLFPGQSSRTPDLIAKLTASDEAAATVARASTILGRDLAAHYDPANPGMFATNRDVQVGVFLANHLHLEALGRAGIHARWSAGLSLGEYNHLVHIGALAFEDALALVDRRGALYDLGPEGMMVSVFPIGADELHATLATAEGAEQIVIGLFNSPRQQVLSGPRRAMETVLARLEEADVYVETVVIEPNIPMHAPAFAPVAAPLREILARAPWRPPIGVYLPNVRGAFVTDADAATIVDCLGAHAHQPVLWQPSVEALAARVPSPLFVEVGPRAVLSHLFNKSWSPGPIHATDAARDWPQHFARVAEELRHAVA
jgi:[acyl-carrier-protein] S-malonyltransferase